MNGTLLRTLVAVALAGCGTGVAAPATSAPASLLETGFARVPRQTFAPQYPLWSDGATKQRWIYLPAGARIDARDPDAWQFPVGTKLWKQFAIAGALAETRYMERTAAGWVYATYDATGALVPARGGRVTVGATLHELPAEAECRACHANGPTPVLGFSALQLSTDRDPLAPHAGSPGEVDLRTLLVAGTLANAPLALVVPPRIPGPPVERAALGYQHGNCSGCHRRGGALDGLGMFLDAREARATTLSRASHFAPAGMRPVRVVPGRPDDSVLLARVRSRDATTQMPPLGTRVVDAAAVDLLRTWIATL